MISTIPRPNPFTLRQYQRESIDAIYKHFEAWSSNPLVVIPTGGGKAPVLATFIREALEAWPDTRILQLVHVKELVSQNHETMLDVMPHCRTSLASASLSKHKDFSGQVIFASIQSVYRNGFDMGKVDLVVVDEAHLIPHKAEGMYRKLLSDLTLANPYIKIIGYTATPFRMQSGRLDQGEGRIFGRIAYEVGIADLIEWGYLSPLIHKGMQTQIDTTGVRMTGGEFNKKGLAEAVDREEVTRQAVAEIVEYGRNRKCWLAFGVSVDHAEHIRDEVRSHGYSAEMIHGGTPGAERDRIISEFKAGRIRCLTNCDVLTTGFNVPQVDLLAVIRPTKSPGLWVQICGRGTRLADGKKDCLVLDFGQNSARHGPVDAIRGKAKRSSDEPGDTPVKECPDCHSLILIAARECPDCGYEFPPPAPNFNASASDDPILSSQVKAERVEVDSVDYARHSKMGKPDSVRVDYKCGLREFNEWLCLDHGGYAQAKAVQWMKDHGAEKMTVDEALEYLPETRPPAAIWIKPEGKYTRVVRREYETEERRYAQG